VKKSCRTILQDEIIVLQKGPISFISLFVEAKKTFRQLELSESCSN